MLRDHDDESAPRVADGLVGHEARGDPHEFEPRDDVVHGHVIVGSAEHRDLGRQRGQLLGEHRLDAGDERRGAAERDADRFRDGFDSRLRDTPDQLS
ncbi:hypothetical protein FBY39_2254 [Microbacterium sp. SLBN-146]|nr:hypothetical protein FBY39_2254 [Microbacterium sp. SLBN-146]